MMLFREKVSHLWVEPWLNVAEEIQLEKKKPTFRHLGTSSTVTDEITTPIPQPLKPLLTCTGAVKCVCWVKGMIHSRKPRRQCPHIQARAKKTAPPNILQLQKSHKMMTVFKLIIFSESRKSELSPYGAPPVCD